MKASKALSPASRPFGLRDCFGYLMGDFGCNMSFALISNYMMLFYTQFIGISLVHYGFIILFAKIWDAINDPMIGAISDRLTPKSGDKFRPWIFWGSFPLAFSACLLFLDTRSWPYHIRILACIIGYLIWDILYTVVNVPYGSMNATITASPGERSQLSTWRSFGSIVAALPISIFLPQILYKKVAVCGAEKSIFQGQLLWIVAVVMGVIALISFQLLYRLCTERITHPNRPRLTLNYFNTLIRFFTNRSMLAVAIAALMQTIFIMSNASTNALVFQMYFGDGSLASYSTVSTVITIIAAPLVRPLVEKFGKKALCTWPMLLCVVAYMLILVVPNISPVLFISLMTLASIGNVFYTMVGWALVSDCIVSMEYQSGMREEGSIYATYSMVRKIGQGIGQSIVPFAIILTIPGLKLDDAATWSPAYGLAIKNFAALLPLIGALATFLCFRLIYDLDSKKLTEIETALRHIDTSME
ncbi:MAG TPA: glycoside-pentoside-hexuronide (GPH):cation symporter [Pseudoflavonifractor sp.]|nr:glycoside-pentoside-hexuronide (GPH):cation symporter [Pseudoflavonifractor sp.]